MATGMMNEIISDHRERMLNLKKYYPFFRLTEISFSQYKDGKYDILDMGYIVMGILRFFIEENNFKEKDVTYPEYLEFMQGFLARDFGLVLTEEDAKELADYIFDRIKNDGKPFTFEYFDPVDRKKRSSRIRMIESNIRGNTVWYSISPDAIEFYLDTKEIREESRISVQQLLLEKMIRAQNFRGGTEVIERINEEVNRLQMKKNEVLATLAVDVYAGIEAYEEFVDTGMQWFSEEEKLFAKNQDLIRAASLKLEQAGTMGESYYRTTKEIYELENQLKIAMNRHADLLRACMDMQKLTDEAVKKAKLSRLRSHVDFKNTLQSMVEADNADLLQMFIHPLLQLNPKKTFPLVALDAALTVRPEKYTVAEKVVEEEPEDIVYIDELEDSRIRENYIFLMNNLLYALTLKPVFTLEEFSQVMCRAYSEKIVNNADYYSFFVNLCAKQEYCIGGEEMASESFLDDILKGEYEGSAPVSFSLQMNSDHMLALNEHCEMSDIIFRSGVR